MKSLVIELEELDSFSEKLVRILEPEMTLGLQGELGAGKTTFVKSLAKSFGYNDGVNSPSYVLENQYSCDGGLLISHWDLYRCSELPEDLWEPCSANTVRLIEWPELLIQEKMLDELIIFNFIDKRPTQRLVELSGRLFDLVEDL